MLDSITASIYSSSNSKSMILVFHPIDGFSNNKNT